MTGRLLAIGLAVVVLGGDADAQRGTAPTAAFAAGLTAYRSGDYAAAAAAFEEAFRGDPRAETAFTLANAQRNQYFIDRDVTRLHRALGLYRHYLLEAPAGARAPHARLHLESIEAILASVPDAAPPAAAVTPPTQLLITGDVPGATASIDGDVPVRVPRLAEVSPGAHAIRVEVAGHDPVTAEALAVAERLVLVPTSLHPRDARIVVRARGARVEVDGRNAVGGVARVPAGEHVITVTARGHQPVTRIVEVAPGGEQRIDLTLRPTAQRRAARWTLIGGAVLAGGAAVAGAIALAAQRDAVMPANGTPADRVAYNAAADRRDAWRGVAIGLAIGATLAGATGAALWWLDEPEATERPTVTPLLGPESIGATVSGRF